MRPRNLVGIFVAIFALACAPAAWADQTLATNSARSVSRFLAIANYCPQQLPTDAALARNYADAFTEMGRKSVSQPVWSKILITEAKRRLVEVQATGDRQWCESQRLFMKDVGDDQLFPGRPR